MLRSRSRSVSPPGIERRGPHRGIYVGEPIETLAGSTPRGRRHQHTSGRIYQIGCSSVLFSLLRQIRALQVAPLRPGAGTFSEGVPPRRPADQWATKTPAPRRSTGSTSSSKDCMDVAARLQDWHAGRQPERPCLTQRSRPAGPGHDRSWPEVRSPEFRARRRAYERHCQTVKSRRAPHFPQSAW